MTPTTVRAYPKRVRSLVFSVSLCIAAAVPVFATAAPVSGLKPEKDTWDEIDITTKAVAGIAGVLIPAVIAWGIHSYNKGQEKQAQKRLSSDLKLRRLDMAREFVPLLLSKDSRESLDTLYLVRVLGDEEFSENVCEWVFERLLEQEEYGKIEALQKDKNRHIALMAAQANGRILRASLEATTAVNASLEAVYYYQTVDIGHTGQITWNDPNENSGQWVVSRQQHRLGLPSQFRMARYLVTNEFFLQFVKDGGYKTKKYWSDIVSATRQRFLSQDQQTLGPATWPSGKACLRGRERHPVTGICYHEAVAFCNWLQEKHSPSEEGWRWCLPTEDMWEFSARGDKAYPYPWGLEFRDGYCNSVETGNRATSEVGVYKEGVSSFGCFDMAGNVWEFVITDDQEPGNCVLRGGSFRNNQHEIKTYLRLYGAPREHRPSDFGFRCAQVYEPNQLFA